MAEPFATLEDLQKHWSDLPGDLEDDATTKLEEASLIIRGLYPGIDRRIESGRLEAAVVTLVVCQMVATLIQRELGGDDADRYEQQSFSSGPFSRSVSFRVREASLFLTKLQKQLLDGGSGRNRMAFTIIPGRA